MGIPRAAGRSLHAVLALAVVVAVWRLFVCDFFYTLWIDRDLWRAAQSIERLLFSAGPEMSGGGRTPGVFWALVLRVYLWVSSDPEGLRALASVAELGAAALAWRAARDHLGPCVASVWVSLVLVSAPLAIVTARLWNPSFLPALTLLALAQIVRAGPGGRSQRLPWLVLVCSLGAQVHLSMLSVLAGGLLTIAACKTSVTRRQVAWSVAIFVVVFGVFLLPGAFDGVEVSRDLVANVGQNRVGTFVSRVSDGGLLVLTGAFAIAWLPLVPAAVALFSLPSLLMAAWGLAPARGGDRRPARGWLAPLVWGAGLAFCLQVSLVSEDVNPRHVVVATMFAALAVSTLFVEASGRLEGRWSVIPGLALGCSVAGNAWAMGAAHRVAEARGFHHHKVLASAQQLTLEETGWTREEVVARTVWADVADDGVRYDAQSHMRWVSFDLKHAALDRPAERCAVVWSGNGSADSVTPLAALEVPPNAVFAHAARHGVHLSVWASRHGNCPRNLGNRYHASPLEAEMDRLGEEGVLTLADGTLAVTRLDVPGLREPAVGVGVEVRPGGARLRLVAQGGRGYDGLSALTFEDVVIELAAERGRQVHELAAGRRQIGGDRSVWLPPWWGPWIDVPPGRYRARARGRAIYDRRGRAKQAVTIALPEFEVEVTP